MRINDISKLLLVKNYGKTAHTAPTSAAPSGSDRLVLSAEARGFMDALKAAREADPVNPQKVEALSERIRRGAYQVDIRQVVDKIVDKE